MAEDKKELNGQSVKAEVPENPSLIQPVSTTAFAQMTQISSYVPPHVWTTEALLDLHVKQKEINDNNVRSLDDQRKREFKLSSYGFIVIAVVVCSGLFFMYSGISGGSQIILGTLTFIAGFLAGRGAK